MTLSSLLAAASIAQVISNATAWIVGILAGVATLFLTVGGLRYLMAGGDPAEVERAKTALKSAAVRRDRLRAGDPGPGDRDRAEVPGRRLMTAAAPACGVLDLSCHVAGAVSSWFTSLVTSAVSPLFALIGRTLLSTPQAGQFATVRSLWTGSLAIADAGYVLLVLAGGIIVMGHQTVQTSWAVKDIAPRLVVGFLAANLSLPLASRAIALADGLSGAIAGQGLDPAQAGAMLRSLTLRVLSSGGMFFVLLALFAVALVLVLAVVFVARLMLTVLLIAVAPLALACHALPQTEGIARWWWRALAGLLLIQSAQALVLVAAARVFLTGQWVTLTAPPGSVSGFDAIQLLCVLYILARIPFWIGRRTLTAGGGRRGPLSSAARFAFAAVVLRRVAPVLSGRAAGPPRRPPPVTAGTRPPSPPPAPAPGSSPP